MGDFTPGLNSLATRADAWARLAAVDPQPDFALLQEASAPPEGFPGVVSGTGVGAEARIWAPHGALSGSSTLDGVREHGWVATGTAASSVGPIVLISLHARTEGSAVLHIEELLSRLAAVLVGSFILAGDLNSCRSAEQVWPGYRHSEFFDEAEHRYGMVNCFWREHNREQRTYWKGCQDVGEAFQDDHMFVSTDLQDHVRSCSVLDYEAFRGLSDHTPMVLEIDV